jgi:antitoxin ParD1/3/4
MPTRNINLTDHYDRFVEQQIAAGRFANASEVLRAGLRLLEQQAREDREKLRLLRSLAAEAFAELDQGEGIEIGDADQLRDVIARAGRQAAGKGRRGAKAE